MICSFCIVAQRRGFVKLLQRNSNKTATILARKKASPSGEAARSRELAGSPPSSGPVGPPSPEGEGSDCRKRCVYPLAPSARGLPPQRVGERTVRQPEIFRAMARFSPSAPTGHLPRRGRFFDTLRLPPEGEGLNRSISPLACGPEMRYNTLNRIV